MPFRLYPRREEPTLDRELFRNPPREYRGLPFWCWNDRLDRSQLLRQIDVMQKMGFGGFHIHSRTGLATEYLGPTWLSLVEMCAGEARAREMLCWIYDEDRWPSGYAGGLVTQHVEFRQRHLLWTRIPYGQNAPRGKSDYTTAVRNETGRLLARYEVELDSTFRLKHFRRLADQEAISQQQTIWYAYIEPASPSTWFNGQTAVDVFSRQAIKQFIATTHERYRPVLDGALRSLPTAFFTDEPQFVKKSQFTVGNELHDLFMPISDDFCDTYRAAFGQDLLDHLPELFWNLPEDAPSLTRYRYHEHTAERFASGFSDTLGEWCEAHGVALTGHMLGEGSLMSQTRGCGEAMRGLRSFHIPGVDMLCDKRELTTVLQARSVAHQLGREGVASELYGVTGWHFDFAGHKSQGDWQAALGVTIRVPHLFWMSMRGEAKRDYPASIGEQSPWFEEYKLIEDHFARLNAVLSRGKPATQVAVIHPIESAWLAWGPKAQNEATAGSLEHCFQQLPQWLLYNGIDFDFVSEHSIDPGVQGSTFAVGKMNYTFVLISPTTTLRSTTLEALERFSDAGGTVVFAGEVARWVDALPSDRARRLAKRSRQVTFDQQSLLHSLARHRRVRIDFPRNEERPFLHRLLIDGERAYLFLLGSFERSRVHVEGHWDVTLLDTHSGRATEIEREVRGETTSFEPGASAPGHLLYELSPATQRVATLAEPPRYELHDRLAEPIDVTLAEPNVVVLDRARLIFGESAGEPTDILVLDNLIRSRLNLPPRNGRGVQPWADREPAPVLSQIELVYDFDSDIDLSNIELAIENPEDATIRLDGNLISNAPIGWWIDQAISRVVLPELKAGSHQLRLTIPFTRKTELEAVYLLGDFGVRVSGTQARIINPVRSLNWGDWTAQGLPFYGGNVIYHARLAPLASRSKLQFPKFQNPLLSIDHNGTRIGTVAFAPYEIELPENIDRLDITAYGNRSNTFGPLHHTNRDLKWIGPGAWRTTGDQWQDAYSLRAMGILTPPLRHAQLA